MTLSPAAQATWDAFNDAYESLGPLEDMGQPIAAALRAAVVQCRYIDDDGDSLIDAEELLAIATELETPQ